MCATRTRSPTRSAASRHRASRSPHCGADSTPALQGTPSPRPLPDQQGVVVVRRSSKALPPLIPAGSGVDSSSSSAAARHSSSLVPTQLHRGDELLGLIGAGPLVDVLAGHTSCVIAPVAAVAGAGVDDRHRLPFRSRAAVVDLAPHPAHDGGAVCRWDHLPVMPTSSPVPEPGAMSDTCLVVPVAASAVPAVVYTNEPVPHSLTLPTKVSTCLNVPLSAPKRCRRRRCLRSRRRPRIPGSSGGTHSGRRARRRYPGGPPSPRLPRSHGSAPSSSGHRHRRSPSRRRGRWERRSPWSPQDCSVACFLPSRDPHPPLADRQPASSPPMAAGRLLLRSTLTGGHLKSISRLYNSKPGGVCQATTGHSEQVACGTG